MTTVTGRPEKPLDYTNPAAATFAHGLRSLRRAAGSPTYRRMAETAHYSAPALSLAANGKKVPTWDCTRAYLHACGVTSDDELGHWRVLWKSARERERQGLATVVVDAESTYEVDVLIDNAAILPTLSGPSIDTDPYSINSIEEFRGALNQLREACDLSLRDLERKSAIVALPRTGDQAKLARSQIHDMLTGKTRLNPRHVHLFLAACALPSDEIRRWLQVLTKLRAEEHRIQAAKLALASLTSIDIPPAGRVPEPMPATLVDSREQGCREEPSLPKRPFTHRGQHRLRSSFTSTLRRLFRS